MDNENLNNKQNIILGLDVSTSCIGCCLLLDKGNDKPEIIELTHIVPKVNKKIKTIEALFLKDQIFKNEFLMKWKDIGITNVVIEEPLLSANNSSLHTVATLLRFNGMISESIYDVLGVVPTYISSYEARLYSFPTLMSVRKFDKKGEPYPLNKIKSALKHEKLVLFGDFPWDCAKKEILQSMVADMYPHIEWLYDKKGELKKENFDSSDAFIACYGYLQKEKLGEIQISVTDINLENNIIHYNVNYWNQTETKEILYINQD